MSISRFFKKDYNMSSKYNMGVTLMRLSVVFFVLTVLLAVWAVSDPPKIFDEADIQEIVVLDVKSSYHRRYRRRNYTSYSATLQVEDGSEIYLTLTAKEYKIVSEAKSNGGILLAPVYTVGYYEDLRLIYISIEGIIDPEEATKVYYRDHPTEIMLGRRIGLAVTGGLFLCCIAAGISEILIAGKRRDPYIGSDGAFDPVKLKQAQAKDSYTAQLMKEFDEAVNKRSDLESMLSGEKPKKNDTLTPQERLAQRRETAQLLAEIDKIVEKKGDPLRYKK